MRIHSMQGESSAHQTGSIVVYASLANGLECQENISLDTPYLSGQIVARLGHEHGWRFKGISKDSYGHICSHW